MAPKPAEQTAASILVWAELIGNLPSPGVRNIVNGFALEAGKPLASSADIAMIAFTGETTTGQLIMQSSSENLFPVTLGPGGMFSLGNGLLTRSNLCDRGGSSG